MMVSAIQFLIPLIVLLISTIRISEVNNSIWKYHQFHLVKSVIRISDISIFTYLEISVIELLISEIEIEISEI